MAGENIGLPQVEKLTDWAKEPSLLDLKADLDAAKPAHDTHSGNVRRWNDLRDVTGKARPKTATGRSAVQPKLIRRQAEWRYSALSEPFLSSEKLFNAEPATWEDTEAAEQNELVINHQFRTVLNKIKFIDEYVRTTVDEGTAIVRLGWIRHVRKQTETVPVYQYRTFAAPEESAALEQALGLKEQNPRAYLDLPDELKAAVNYFLETGTPTVAEVIETREVEEEIVLANHPTVEMVHPDNIFIDPSCGNDIDKATFVVVSFETSKAELLADGRYKNLDAVNWSGNTVLTTPDHETRTPGDFNFKDDLRKRIVAHEYWGSYDVDGSERLKPIVATWIGDVIIRMEANPFPDEKPPFVLVPYLPVKRALMGEPDAEILDDNQAILGAVTRGMIDLMGRSANAQQGMLKGFLDPVNRRRFEQGQDYEFNTQGDPRLSVYQHSYPEIPRSAMEMLQLQNYEAEAMTGVKSFAGGLSGQAYGDVAAGIKGMLDASAKREMNILRRLAKGIQDVGTKIMAMNAVFLSEEETIRITNDKFVTVRREDLKGKFDLIVDIATAEVDEAKAQDLGFMLQTMGPDMDPEMSRMILSEIAKLKRMPALAHMIKTYQPTPDPLEVQLKELEIRKLAAEVAELESKAMLNQSKAREAEASADQKDLDYVEQESGTKHVRDLQKNAEQARSNQDLEVTKSLLSARKPDERGPDIAAAVGFNTLTDPSGRI